MQKGEAQEEAHGVVRKRWKRKKEGTDALRRKREEERIMEWDKESEKISYFRMNEKGKWKIHREKKNNKEQKF